MVTLQNYVCAFLEHNGSFLLLKRAPDRKVNPGVWSGVGGKMEPCEINDPYAACLREIREETGILPHELEGLSLRYILLRRHGHVIRQSYIYFGRTATTNITPTEEGTLHWVPRAELLHRPYTPTYRKMIAHFLSGDADEAAVILGVAVNNAGNLAMRWTKVEDFTAV